MGNKWCNIVGCWIDEVKEITDGSLSCGYDCEDCEYCEVVTTWQNQSY